MPHARAFPWMRPNAGSPPTCNTATLARKQSVSEMTTAYDIKQLKDYAMFPIMAQENMRYRDLDINGHMNNAVYATYFELARGRARRALPGSSTKRLGSFTKLATFWARALARVTLERLWARRVTRRSRTGTFKRSDRSKASRVKS